MLLTLQWVFRGLMEKYASCLRRQKTFLWFSRLSPFLPNGNWLE